MSAAARPAAIARATRRFASRRRGRDASSRHRFEDGQRGGVQAVHPARATTRASTLREGRSDDGPTLVETSSGGQQLRRWGRTPTGRLRSPAPAATGGGTRWTGRRSDGPRLRFREVGPEAVPEAARRLPARGLPRHRLPGLRSVHPVAPRLPHVPQRPRGHHCAESARSRSGWAPPPARSRSPRRRSGSSRTASGPSRRSRRDPWAGRSATRIPSGGGW